MSRHGVRRRLVVVLTTALLACGLAGAADTVTAVGSPHRLAVGHAVGVVHVGTTSVAQAVRASVDAGHLGLPSSPLGVAVTALALAALAAALVRRSTAARLVPPAGRGRPTGRAPPVSALTH